MVNHCCCVSNRNELTTGTTNRIELNKTNEGQDESNRAEPTKYTTNCVKSNRRKRKKKNQEVLYINEGICKYDFQ